MLGLDLFDGLCTTASPLSEVEVSQVLFLFRRAWSSGVYLFKVNGLIPLNDLILCITSDSISLRLAMDVTRVTIMPITSHESHNSRFDVSRLTSISCPNCRALCTINSGHVKLLLWIRNCCHIVEWCVHCRTPSWRRETVVLPQSFLLLGLSWSALHTLSRMPHSGGRWICSCLYNPLHIDTWTLFVSRVLTMTQLYWVGWKLFSDHFTKLCTGTSFEQKVYNIKLLSVGWSEFLLSLLLSLSSSKWAHCMSAFCDYLCRSSTCCLLWDIWACSRALRPLACKSGPDRVLFSLLVVCQTAICI